LLNWRVRVDYLQNKEVGEDLQELYEAVLDKFEASPSYAKKK